MNRRWMAVQRIATFPAGALLSAEERVSHEDREDAEVQMGLRIQPVPLDAENEAH